MPKWKWNGRNHFLTSKKNKRSSQYYPAPSPHMGYTVELWDTKSYRTLGPSDMMFVTDEGTAISVGSLWVNTGQKAKLTLEPVGFKPRNNKQHDSSRTD